MNQIVRTADGFQNQLFQWNPEGKIITLVHGKFIWAVQLGDDNLFTVISCFEKPHKATKVA